MKKSQAGTFWIMGLTAVAVLGLLVTIITKRHQAIGVGEAAMVAWTIEAEADEDGVADLTCKKIDGGLHFCGPYEERKPYAIHCHPHGNSGVVYAYVPGVGCVDEGKPAKGLRLVSSECDGKGPGWVKKSNHMDAPCVDLGGRP